MKYLRTPLAIAACLGLGWAVYRNSQAHIEQTRPADQAEPIAVQVTRVRTQPLEERVQLVGSLEATAAVEIRSRIDGYITRLPFDVGEFVQESQVVVELESSQGRELVSRSEAALRVAQAQLQAQKTKEALARTEVQRQRTLAESGVITPQQREQAEAQLAIADAEVELQQARVAQAESDVLQSKLALGDARIAAPLSGFVAERFVETGDLAAPNTPLLRIVDLTQVRTMVHVVEKDYEKVQPDQNAVIQVDAFPGRTFAGKVVRKAPVLDPATRTAAVQIEVPNPQALLKPGMHARVILVFNKRKRAAVVPVASLIGLPHKPAVYVVVGDSPLAQLQPVKTGIVDGDFVEILSGIGPDDRVMTLGNRIVQHGQPVVPIEVPLATADVAYGTNAVSTGSNTGE